MTVAGSPLLSLVVPTRNERDNIDRLVDRMTHALQDVAWPWEMLLVDDSDDDTPERARRAARSGRPVRLLHRAPEDRLDGLSGAVALGFGAARGEILAVMDADLQHPPEVVAELVRAVATGGADVAVASRYCSGCDVDAADGLDGGWRRFVSRASRWPAWLLRPRVRRVRDPLSGFFAVHRCVLDGVALRPLGYKILLEVLVRGHWRHVVEIPYRFAPRAAGTSKAELRQGRTFLHHLLRLATDRGPIPRPVALRRRLHELKDELIKFSAVGGLVFMVDLAVFNLLRIGLGVGPLTSKTASVVVATTVAYIANRWWTFRHRARSGVPREYSLFFLLNGVGLGITLVCLGVSHYVLGLTSPQADNVSANVIGLALSTAFRFWSYRRFVFLDPAPGRR